MNPALLQAALASLCFGLALNTGRAGLAHLPPRAGAAIGVPSSLALFLLLSPFTIDWQGFHIGALVVFALVGLFFPGGVTLVTYRSNETLGPTVTASLISGTAPLFALAAAWLLLDEPIPPKAAFVTLCVVLGIVLITWTGNGLPRGAAGRLLLWPLSGALMRGLAQAVIKFGLVLWPSAFAASLVGYAVSTLTVLGFRRMDGPQRTPPSRAGVAWFACTGLLNGAGLCLMYDALITTPVAVVSPIVASYPGVTLLVSGLLRQEAFSRRRLAGTLVIVLAVVYLVGGF